MRYESGRAWRGADEKRLMLFGMSGLGKTHISNLLRETGGWFHYSVDYRIGTRYLGEHIADNAKAEAMKVPFLAELLKTDSIYIASNITFENLTPLSTWLGKPGDAAKGGLAIEEYQRRQALHHAAEVSAMLDTGHFVRRARDLYGYGNFVCDTSGSVCEVVDVENPADPVMSALSSVLLPVWIEGSEAHTETLIARFSRAPKPMCYQPEFLLSAWRDYLAEKSVDETRVDPDDFVRWTYARALRHRQPRYRAMADRWGVTVAADDMARVAREDDLVDLIAAAIDAKG